MNPDDRVTADPGPASPGWRWALVGVLALALVLRLLEARGLRLDFDEIYIVLVGRMSVSDLLRIVAADIHPPLHFVVRHLWQLVTGEGDHRLKLLSILFSLGTVALTAMLGRRLVSPRAGLLAALFAALCPGLIALGQLVDVVPMTQLLIAALAWTAWRAVERRRLSDHALLAVTAIAALYTSYLAIPASVALLAWGTWALRREPRALAAWLGTWAAATLAFAPWFPTLVAQFHRELDASFFTFPSPRGLYDLSRRIAFGSYVAPALIVPLAAIALLDRRRRLAMTMLAMLVVVVVPSTRLWAFVVTRDMMAVAPFVYVMVAAGIERLPGRLTGPVLSLLLLAVAVREVHHHQRDAETLALTLVEDFVHRGTHPDEMVLHAETHSVLFFRYYDPARRNLLLVEPGTRPPYFEGGLVIPDSWLITPSAWAAARDSGAGWWGVRVDRAFTTHGHSTRAGARDAAEFDSLAHDRKWTIPPVEMWHGRPAHR